MYRLLCIDHIVVEIAIYFIDFMNHPAIAVPTLQVYRLQKKTGNFIITVFLTMELVFHNNAMINSSQILPVWYFVWNILNLQYVMWNWVSHAFCSLICSLKAFGKKKWWCGVDAYCLLSFPHSILFLQWGLFYGMWEPQYEALKTAARFYNLYFSNGL